MYMLNYNYVPNCHLLVVSLINDPWTLNKTNLITSPFFVARLTKGTKVIEHTARRFFTCRFKFPLLYA